MNKPIDYRAVRDWIKEQDRINTVSKQEVRVYEMAIWKQAQEDKTPCIKCGRTTMQSVDHIVPRQILEAFGIDHDKEFINDNYQILCKPCNSLKSNRLDFSTPKTKEILTILLNRI